jgi:hypothetical protein
VRVRKLVLGLAALSSAAVVAALFVLMRGEPREIDASPVAPAGGSIAVQAHAEHDAALDAQSADASAERAEVHAPTGTSASAGHARAGDEAQQFDSFIAGDVVDESGRALANVEVSAQRFWSESETRVLTDNGRLGDFLRAQSSSTDQFGHFRIAVSGEAHVLLSALAEGFEGYQDSWRDNGRAPGTSDARLVLHALPRARFRVVDASTQQPVENFGLRLTAMRESSPRGAVSNLRDRTDPPKATMHTDGICELYERPELSSFLVVDASDGGFKRDQGALTMRGYQIEAAGYAPQCGWIAPAAHTADGQTISLEHGGSISARALVDGQPAAFVAASLRLAKADETQSDPQITDARAFLGRARRFTGTSDGALKFVDLPTGTYQLEVQLQAKAKLVIERVEVVQGMDTALGDLRMVSNPNVKCTLLVPDGRVPSRYSVKAESAGEEAEVPVDSRGEFWLSSLPAGHWKIEAPAEPSFFCDGPPLEFDVAADQRELTLDLRGRVGGWLTLIVRVNGVPTPGVTLLARSGTRVVAEDRHTAGQGISVLWIDATAPIDVFFTTAKGLPLGRASEALSVPRGGEVEVTCDLQVGELVVDTSSLTDLRTLSTTTLLLESDREPKMLAPIALAGGPSRAFHPESIAPDRTNSLPPPPPRTALGPVAAGAYRARLRTSARNSPDDPVSSIDYVRDLVIRAGEVNEVRFTEADRAN